MSRIFLSPPDVGPLEREFLLGALDRGWVAPVGPDLDGFEADVTELTGWPGAVALSSGTAALHLALLIAGVGPGDDVFVSSFTFAATANAVKYCGARPAFVDSDSTTWNMNPQLLADALDHARRRNRLPKAVVVVDLYGQCADYDAIVPQCRDLGIAVIEDSAEALGSTYRDRPGGTLADLGVFSFNGNKIITTSGGGMLVAPDEATAARIRYLATQARQPTVHYEHTEIGFNYRLSNLLAALGRAQLQRLPEMSARRIGINSRYRQVLGEVEGVEFMPLATHSTWNGWLTCLQFAEPTIRNAVIDALEAHDVESRPLWKPMHLQPVFAESPAWIDGTSDALFAHGLCLPSGSTLTDDQVDAVAKVVADVVRSHP